MLGVKLQIWLYGLLALVLVVLTTSGIAYHKGKANVQEDWDASIERGQTLLEELKGKRAVITVTADVQYVERVKVIREKAKTIVEQVPVYVSVDAPDLDGGFRVLHDAASSNTLPNPSSIADAAPVPAQTLATTVTENYGTCHETSFRLTKLQTWVAEQTAVVVEPP